MNIRAYSFSFLSFFLFGLSLSVNADIENIQRFPLGAVKSVGLLTSERVEFSPSINEGEIAISFALNTASKVTLDVLSADGDLVRRLLDEKNYEAGEQLIIWDGKDDLGNIVPDEAYRLLFNSVAGDKTYVDNPASYSGGEIIPNIEYTRTTETSLSYELPAPARVLVRMGIKDGPKVRELRHWTPSVEGKVVDRWNGFDSDNVEYYADREDLWVVIKAYELPQYSVITTGNNQYDYRTYRKKRGWDPLEPELGSIELQRKGVRLSQDYFLPRDYLPRVSLQFEHEPEKNRVGLPIVEDKVRFKIDVPAEDKWILDSSFYETGLYINYQFQSEEEQGFVPMIWEYDASGLDEGRHIATVQLFGFGGFISSSTVEFFKN